MRVSGDTQTKKEVDEKHPAPEAHSFQTMFARSVIRRHVSYADVMAKTAAHTVNSQGEGSGQAVCVFSCMIAVACAGFWLNKSTPSTQVISPYYNRLYGAIERRNW